MLALIDWILHGIDLLLKNGLTATTIVGLLIFGIRQLIKNRKLLRRLKKYLPWIASDDDSEVKSYVANQARIEMKIDLLLQERGIEWNVITIEGERKDSRRDSKSYSASPYRTNTIVPSTGWYTNWGKKTMNKLKSRKFWLTVIGAAIVILNEVFDLGLSAEAQAILAGIIVSFIVSEGVVDAKRAGKEQTNDFETPIEPRL